ncbi:hypothetical protein NM688_g4757 [Phlebia brevispora]|uniref:Uncharacterized protein n=1 Tax=Phlebia brevispora TaxID=194682 RepID=A0ACC1T1Q5_9APHY|nr:hypothetical protein NM688_g4757 [Phlebia brevispora]
MSQRLSVEGLYGDLPVSILIDYESERSWLSLTFSTEHQVPRTVRMLPGGVPLQTVHGPVTIGSVGLYDLVLGRDWIVGCAFVTHDGLVRDPEPDWIPSDGHRWIRDPMNGDVHTMSDFTYQRDLVSIETNRSCSRSPERPGEQGGESSSIIWSEGNRARAGPTPVLPTDNTDADEPVSVSVFEADPLTASSVFYHLTSAQLRCRLESHGITCSPAVKGVTKMRDTLLEHITSGACSGPVVGPACAIIQRRYAVQDIKSNDNKRTILRIRYLHHAANWMQVRPLKRLMKHEGLTCPPKSTVAVLRKSLKDYVNRLEKGKFPRQGVLTYGGPIDAAAEARYSARNDIQRTWPQVVPKGLKEKIVSMFRQETSSETLRTFVCACCAERASWKGRHVLPMSELPLDDLCSADIPDGLTHELYSVASEDGECKIMLDRAGILDDGKSVQVCKTCHGELRANRVPHLALANKMFLGEVPPELKDLTEIEEAVIARCRAKCCIVKIGDDGVYKRRELPTMQRALRGNIIEFPQKPGALARALPPPVDEIVSFVCVIFTGHEEPTKQWLLEKARPLAVRRDKVRQALIWLKGNNPLYADLEIDESALHSLPEDGILPYHVEMAMNTEEADALVSRYDAGDHLEEANMNEGNDVEHNRQQNEIAFQSVVIADLDGNVPAAELQVAALRHFKERHGGYIQVPHGPEPRREVLLRSSLKVKRRSFTKVAAEFQNISVEAIRSVCERVAAEEHVTANNEDERRVLKLMKEVNLVTANVPGTSGSKIYMRNQIRGMMLQLGLPSFFITINPADVYNPVVKFLAGQEIDVDRLTLEQVPDRGTQSVLIAKNPFVGARFFNLYMNAFFRAVLGYDRDAGTYTEEGGILGHVTGYYGCVEAQGRGSLHCHLLVWLEGALNPDEIRDRLMTGDDAFGLRLVQYLDDTISNSIPEMPSGLRPGPRRGVHSSAVRGVNFNVPDDVRELAEREDLHLLVKDCQTHRHSHTCYKYCKPGQPLECRFDMDPENTCPQSTFDMTTGDLCLRCLDGMVNNFNETIIRAVRCNMDIKFVGSGDAAKAIIYYITNYITKSELKTHVAYAALELAINRLRNVEDDEEDDATKAKRLLRKCAFALLTHQEMSAQQIALFMIENEGKYCSHDFSNLYWTSFEAHLEKLLPSPECYGSVSLNASEDTELQIPESSRSEEPELQSPGLTRLTDDFGDEQAVLQSQQMELESTEVEESSEPQNLTEEVVLGIDDDGTVIAKADQMMDYIHRPVQLDKISVWEFVRHIVKEKKPKVKRHAAENEGNSDIDETGNADEDCEVLTRTILKSYLESNKRKREYFPLLSTHPEVKTKVMKIRHPSSVSLVVPIGPALPRRDKPEVYQKYCRLMLLLFKPWRTAADLRNMDQSWSEAFELFQEECPPELTRIMNNMQAIHECKDNSGDHFRNRAHMCRFRMPQEMATNETEPTALAETLEDEDILRHVQESKSSKGPAKLLAEARVMASVTCAISNGLYTWNELTEDAIGSSERGNYGVNLCSDGSLEKAWERRYQERRAALKGKAVNDTVDSASGSERDRTIISDGPDRSIIQSLDSARSPGPSNERQINTPSIVQGCVFDKPDVEKEIEAIIQTWTLNDEQARAFKIIATHAAKPRSERDQLRMFLGGPGGTGKSRVINALRDFFARRGEKRRFRLASFMGIAAHNIGGITLHAACCLNKKSGPVRVGSKTHQDLAAMWEGVDYLFVDEVSMLGCLTLAKANKALSIATGKAEPFGGVNVIFAGDFAQLPPVGEIRLYGTMKSTSAPSSAAYTKLSRTVFGKLLWLSIDVVVMLKKVMRQSGDSNNRFVDLLSRLRTGACIDDDFDILNTRQLSRISLHGLSENWKRSPVVVYDNATKDALNVKAVEAFARSTGRELQWFYCIDKHRGRTLANRELREALYEIHSGATEGLLGRIPLVLGMKVIISKNFDLEGGALNGTVGVLRKIRSDVNEYGERILKSCIVYVHDSGVPTMQGLQEKEIPVLPETKDWSVRHPFSGALLGLTRTQVALQPAYAFTCHRVQGQTFEKVVIDLESCSGTEAPYVMLSRARSLDGVAILRPFLKKRIRGKVNKDLLYEFDRQSLLDERTSTIAHDGNSAEFGLRTQSNRNLADNLTISIDDIPSGGNAAQDRLNLLERIQSNMPKAIEALHPNRNANTGSRKKRRIDNDDMRRAGKMRRIVSSSYDLAILHDDTRHDVHTTALGLDQIVSVPCIIEDIAA